MGNGLLDTELNLLAFLPISYKPTVSLPLSVLLSLDLEAASPRPLALHLVAGILADTVVVGFAVDLMAVVH